MKKRFLAILLLTLITAIFLAGCGKRITRARPTVVNRTSIETAAYQTIVAEFTPTPSPTPTPVAVLFIPAIPVDRNETDTPTPTATEPGTPFMNVSIAHTYTPTPKPPTPTPVTPTATPTQQLCYAAEFVQDINTPPGTNFVGGQKFRKIWRVKNIGSCVWDRTFNLIVVEGESLGAGSTNPINAIVAPGATVDLILDLSSPKKNGDYETGFMLYNNYGQVFGVGDGALEYLWVDISVVNPATATAKATAGSNATATSKATSSSSGSSGATATPAGGTTPTATRSSSGTSSTATSQAATATSAPATATNAQPAPTATPRPPDATLTPTPTLNLVPPTSAPPATP